MGNFQRWLAAGAAIAAASCAAHDQPGVATAVGGIGSKYIDLAVSPGDKLAACQALAVRATADSPQGAVSFRWKLVPHDGAAAYAMSASGRFVRFAAAGPGDYDLAVTALVGGAALDTAMLALRVDGQGDCLGIDRDKDGVPDVVDNCPDVANPDGADGNGDGVGDVCARDDGHFHIDGALAGAELAALRLDGAVRPAVALMTPDAQQARFVEDEIVVVGASQAQLDDVVARRAGRILGTVTGGNGLPEMSSAVLLRVRVDPGQPLDDLERFLVEHSPDKSAQYAISSDVGLRLLALAAEETARYGLHATVNWTGEPDTIPGRTTVEGAEPTLGGYAPNAFGWPQWTSGSLSLLDIGVGEAWVQLWNAGRLSQSVAIGVLDQGFDGWFRDVPPSSEQLSIVPLRGPGSSALLGCSNPECWYHGANVTLTAAGVADNGAGAAGPGGPVARTIQIWLLYDAFSTVAGVIEAARRGARVINMSYSNDVPAPFDAAVIPLEGLMAIAAGGNALLVASAGNHAWDITPTFGIDWMHIFPCEGLGVLCVGATNEGDPGRASYSNWSSHDGGVDLFAPGTVFVGPTPTRESVHRFSGTSAAAPFVSGVAALVMTANPSLLPPDAMGILLRTAHISGDPAVRRWVNAAAAVDAAFAAAGNQPPVVRLFSPASSPATLQANQGGVFRVVATDVEDGPACCTVIWSSDIDGELGRGATITASFASLGRRIVTVRAVDSGGRSSMPLSIAVDVINTPPSVSVAALSSDAWVGRPASFSALATDPNEPGGRIACSQLHWVVTDPDTVAPLTGCSADVRFGTPGDRSVTVETRDSFGVYAAATVVVHVAPLPSDPPPDVHLSVTRRGGRAVVLGDDAVEPTDAPLHLAANATDDDPLLYIWFAHGPGDSLVFLGDTPTLDWDPATSFPQNGFDVGIRIELRVWDGVNPADHEWQPFVWAAPAPP